MPQSDLNILAIQADLVWEQAEANRAQLQQHIEQSQEAIDLIVLPEMFTTGFSMEPSRLAEQEQGPSLEWMQGIAQAQDAVVTGSIIVEDDGQYYNRLFWVRADGSYSTYNKRHLFSLAGEQKVYHTKGQRIIESIKDWRICPLICYDLRFPVWSRNQFNKDGASEYDVLLYVANWPNKRMYPWTTLLKARAIENQAFVMGVNRCGYDGNDTYHSGNSMLVEPSGQVQWEATYGEVEAQVLKLSRQLLIDNRSHFQFLADGDRFELQ